MIGVDVPQLRRVPQHAMHAPVLDEAHEQVFDAVPRRCRERGGGAVKDEDIRVGDESAGDGDCDTVGKRDCVAVLAADHVASPEQLA